MADRKADKTKKNILEDEEMNFYTKDTTEQKLVIMHQEEKENLMEQGSIVNVTPKDRKATDVTLGLRNMGLR
jgi:hypothetical protein